MLTWTYDPNLGDNGGYIVPDCPLNCDGDGANGQTGGVACYVPAGSDLPHLDGLADAGHPGNWWALACDVGGLPYIQQPGDPAPGAYISTTSYQYRFRDDGVTPRPVNDPYRYLDAAAVPFIVVPGAFVRGVPGAVQGCRCEVEHAGRVVPAMVGDIGPDFGEFSLYLCQQLDPTANCYGTSISRGVTIRIFPGEAFPGYDLQKA